GTDARQRTVVATIATLADRVTAEGLAAPVITIVGRSVALREEIGWFETRPLLGRRIAVTRATAVGGTLSAQLRLAGADVIDAPVSTIVPMDTGPIDRAIAELASYDWLVLTSQVGVQLFWKALRRVGRDARALAEVRVAVIG